MLNRAEINYFPFSLCGCIQAKHNIAESETEKNTKHRKQELKFSFNIGTQLFICMATAAAAI